MNSLPESKVQIESKMEIPHNMPTDLVMSDCTTHQWTWMITHQWTQMVTLTNGHGWLHSNGQGWSHTNDHTPMYMDMDDCSQVDMDGHTQMYMAWMIAHQLLHVLYQPNAYSNFCHKCLYFLST